MQGILTNLTVISIESFHTLTGIRVHAIQTEGFILTWPAGALIYIHIAVRSWNYQATDTTSMQKHVSPIFISPALMILIHTDIRSIGHRPLNPAWQRHSHALILFLQVALFWQGWLRHSSMSSSQCMPSYPASQLQIYPSICQRHHQLPCRHRQLQQQGTRIATTVITTPS